MNDKVTTLLFLKRNNEVLLAMKKRGHGQGYFNGCGGKIEQDESVEQAMIRECEEEIGVTPTIYTKQAELSFLMDSDTNKSWYIYSHVFTATEWQDEPAESEEMAPEWFKLTEIPFEHMWEDDKYWLLQILAGQKLTGDFKFSTTNKLLASNVAHVSVLPDIIPQHS